MTARGLDHIVHVVRDLDATGEFYARAGFTVGTRNHNPWGTHNRIVQLPGFFIELLTLAQPEQLTDEGIALHFGGLARDVLARGEGLAMLVLLSADAAKDAAAFAAAGIALSPPLRFERFGRRPDKSPVKVAFSLAFARDKRSPATGFFVCQQHFPENFWNPALQGHANGATAVLGAVLIAEEPDAHRDFLLAFAGTVEFSATPGTLRLATPRGEIEIMDAANFRRRFAAEPAGGASGMRVAALRLAVRDARALDASLERGGVKAIRHHDLIVLAAPDAAGAILIFEPMAGR
ncbi:MAG: VOC family protein [Proteobacteria bacterium]|nr:VOC family protein [Pseudomonadota bacterium]